LIDNVIEILCLWYYKQEFLQTLWKSTIWRNRKKPCDVKVKNDGTNDGRNRGMSPVRSKWKH